MNVLIADDNDDGRKLLRCNAEKHGCTLVIEARDGQEGLELARKHKPDLIVSDALMPRLDGFQFLRALKRDAGLRDIPFIFYSAVYTGAKEQELARALGAEGFLVKPQTPEDLWAAITSLLRQRKAPQERPPPAELPEAETGFLERYSEVVAITLKEKTRALEDLLAQREQAETALRENEARLSMALEVSHAGTWEWNIESDAVRFDARFHAMLGYAPGELPSTLREWKTFHHPGDLPVMLSKAEAYLHGDCPSYESEHRIRTKAGGWSWVFTRGKLVNLTPTGAPKQFIGIAMDITDRKRTEMELTLLATVIEQTAEAIFITDLTGAILYANPAFETITGYTRQEALGQNPRLLQSGRHDAAFYRALWDTLKRGEVWQGHFINKRKDGALCEEDAIISPIRDAAGVIANYAAVKRDVTREAQLEQDVQQAQKIDAVGRLAGGIAHDFNNIIEAILGFSEITLATMSPQDAHRQDLLEIQKAGRRAADLTRQLLTFSRRQMIMPVVLDLNTLIANLQKMLTRLIGEDVQLAISLAPDLKFIKADVGQIEQVIMNLAVNARDAMPAGGRLVIGTSAVTVTEADAAAIPDSRPGDFVRLTVADTGAGMTPEVLAHIFEPFFTTKGPDKGTGLGLAVIYGIVKRHDGWIHVSTQVGQGSTFTVYLPAYVSLEPAAAAIAAEATLPPPSGHGEHLLVIEDQADVCNLVARVLREAGYEVAAATTALSAQRIFDQAGGRFDLVFSDVVLPDQSGFDLVAAFQEWKPGLKVLLCSGYTDERVHWHTIEERGFRFLQKPYTFAVLLRVIRAILDARAAPT